MDFRRRRPGRGGTILTLGILGILICGPLAVAAWVMGTNDLGAMRRGDMDRSSEGTTRAGMILGIIGTILWVILIFVRIALLSGNKRF